MPRKEGLRHLHIEIPEELDNRLKAIFKAKGAKSIVLREVLINFCNKMEAANGQER